MSTRKIHPKYAECYKYTTFVSNENGERIEIHISIPEEVVQSQLSVKSNKEKYCISIGIKDELPFLAGKLYAPFTKFTYSVKGGLIVARITPEKPESWPILISADISGCLKPSEKIDPQSAFILSQHLFGQNPAAESLWQYAMNVMFAPAILSRMVMLSSSGQDIRPLLPQVQQLADSYKDVDAALTIGNCAILGLIDMKLGLLYLRKGSEQNSEACKLILGTVLSPCEEPYGDFKDVKASWELLKQVANQPRAKYAMAKLYGRGIGCKQDVILARKLMIEARQELPDLEELDFLKTIANPKQSPVQENLTETQSSSDETWYSWPTIVGVSTLLGVGIALGFSLLKRRRNR